MLSVQTYFEDGINFEAFPDVGSNIKEDSSLISRYMIRAAEIFLLPSIEMGKVWTNMFEKSLGDKSKLTLKGILDWTRKCRMFCSTTGQFKTIWHLP